MLTADGVYDLVNIAAPNTFMGCDNFIVRCNVIPLEILAMKVIHPC